MKHRNQQTKQIILLNCMLKVYHEEVTREINKANFVSIIADETTDVSSEFQLVIILRYISSCRPVERFCKFVNPSGHDAVSITNA
ncbi:unnamed protein product, partial [Callosobruchus maculatus]